MYRKLHMGIQGKKIDLKKTHDKWLKKLAKLIEI